MHAEEINDEKQEIWKEDNEVETNKYRISNETKDGKANEDGNSSRLKPLERDLSRAAAQGLRRLHFSTIQKRIKQRSVICKSDSDSNQIETRRGPDEDQSKRTVKAKKNTFRRLRRPSRKKQQSLK